MSYVLHEVEESSAKKQKWRIKSSNQYLPYKKDHHSNSSAFSIVKTDFE